MLDQFRPASPDLVATIATVSGHEEEVHRLPVVGYLDEGDGHVEMCVATRTGSVVTLEKFTEAYDGSDLRIEHRAATSEDAFDLLDNARLRRFVRRYGDVPTDHIPGFTTRAAGDAVAIGYVAKSGARPQVVILPVIGSTDAELESEPEPVVLAREGRGAPRATALGEFLTRWYAAEWERMPGGHAAGDALRYDVEHGVMSMARAAAAARDAAATNEAAEQREAVQA